MLGRSSKPKHVMLKGDISKSDHLRRVVEQKIAIIDAIYANNPIRIYRKKIELGNGAWADYWHISDEDKKVTIHTPEGQLDTSPVNGLASGSRTFLNADSAFTKFYERDKGQIQSGLVGRSVAPWLYYPVATYYVPPIFTKPPGKYTGEMRKVIQAMLSTGQYLQYEYRANLCHGVYTTARDNKWIIKISSQGVHAAKMPLRDHNPFLDWLGYSPAGIEEPMSDWEGYKQLATPSEVLDFYNKGVLFPSCGWAFNSTGSQAVNCCYVGGYGGPYGTPAVGYMYTITITEDEDEPISASMTLEESGSYALPADKGLKHPNITDDALERDEGGWANGQQVISSFSAPRYAFYVNDALIVVRSKGGSGTGSTGDGEIVDSLPSPWGSYNAHYGGVTPCGYPNEAEAFLLGIGAGGTYHVNLDGASTDFTGTAVDGQEVRHSMFGRSIRCTFTTKAEMDAMVIYYASPTAYPLKWQQNDWEISVDGARSTSFIIIPLGDRESVFQFHDQVESEGCYGTVRDMLIGNAVIHRESGGYSECPTGCKDTLTSAHSQFMKSSATNWNRFKSPPKWGVCSSTCSNAIDAPYLTGYSQGTMESKGAIRRQQLWYIDGSGANERMWSTVKSASTSEFTNPESSYTQETDPNYPQRMYVSRDNTQDLKAFTSKKMNGSSYADTYVLNIDEVKYPLSTVPNRTTNAFWVGDPHCVNNDCEE